MKKKVVFLLVSAISLISFVTAQQQQQNVWPAEEAKTWYAKQPWYVGCNFLPSYAINQLEMWQAETFDTTVIRRELSWASSVGMNCARVFLHDLLYKQDPSGFLKRMDVFLKIANRYKIKVMFVFFDSVWDPYPYLGKQRDPRPGVHNSGWVQSPGKHALIDSTQYQRLELYVKAVVKRFANDERILCWDVWNEPDNMNGNPYRDYEPENKIALVTNLLAKVFNWARSQNPAQPLTSGIWQRNYVTNLQIAELVKIQLGQSDIISFHSYGNGTEFKELVDKLTAYNKPMICTEFLAKGIGCTFEEVLPVAKKLHAGAMCWGLVSGKSNTIYDWDSWKKPNIEEPKIWHHDLFRKDGQPYSDAEVKFIKELTLPNK